MIELKGIHRRKAKGIEYHMLRGAPGSRFWKTGDCEIGSKAYRDAYDAAVERFSAPARRDAGLVPEMVDAFLSSGAFQTLKPRTQADYAKWADRFSKHFADMPLALWQDPRTRRDMMKFRDRWAHSPKQADYAVTVAVRILNFARDAAIISSHNCDGLSKMYRVDRSEIVIPPHLQDAFERVATPAANRMFRAAINTGLSPNDLARLSRSHIVQSGSARRIQIRRGKTRRLASIPVTEEMGRIIDETPPGRLLILVSERGRPLTPQRFSQYLKRFFREAGFPDEIKPMDTRGTAATNLLLAGADLGEIATFMGWSLRYAAGVIDRYAAVAPEMTDAILVKLEAGKRRSK